MKLHESLKNHENEKPVRKNNQYFAENNIVFCIVAAELEDNPFQEHFGQRWSVSIVYSDANGRQSGKLIFAHSNNPKEPTRWDRVFGIDNPDLPAHNFILDFNKRDKSGIGDVKGGYKLVWTEAPDETCPCHKPKLQTVDETLAEYGFQQAPATPAERHAVEVLALALKLPVPAELDDFSSQQCKDWIEQARTRHIETKAD